MLEKINVYHHTHRHGYTCEFKHSIYYPNNYRGAALKSVMLNDGPF